MKQWIIALILLGLLILYLKGYLFIGSVVMSGDYPIVITPTIFGSTVTFDWSGARTHDKSHGDTVAYDFCTDGLSSNSEYVLVNGWFGMCYYDNINRLASQYVPECSGTSQAYSTFSIDTGTPLQFICDGRVTPGCHCPTQMWRVDTLTGQTVAPFSSSLTTANLKQIHNVFELKTIVTTQPIVTTTPGPTPPPPPSNLWELIVQTIMNWLQTLWGWVTGSIVGGGTFEPGQQAIFSISLSSPIDTDCSDGSCQVQYGSWAVIDDMGNIKQEANWNETTGTYTDTVTVTVPTTTGKYAFVAVLYNYDLKYNGGWNTISEGIAIKEAVEFTVGIPSPPPPPPPNWLAQIISTITSWLQSIFSWLGV